MKKARILKICSKYPSLKPETENHQEIGPDVPINKEIVKKKPTTICKNGFISFIRKIKHTNEGMESEIQKPMLIDELGQRSDEIEGQCAICTAYVSHISICYVHGCKKRLCDKHTYFFVVGDKEVPLCPEHYKELRNEFDTWQAYKPKWRPKEKDEK